MFNKLKSALWISKVEREELKVERSAHIVVLLGKKDQLIGALGGGQLHRPDFPSHPKGCWKNNPNATAKIVCRNA